MQIFERFSPLFLTNSFSNLFFLKSLKDVPTKMFEDLQKNEISRRSYVKIFMRSHSSEDLKKDLGPGQFFYLKDQFLWSRSKALFFKARVQIYYFIVLYFVLYLTYCINYFSNWLKFIRNLEFFLYLRFKVNF